MRRATFARLGPPIALCLLLTGCGLKGPLYLQMPRVSFPPTGNLLPPPVTVVPPAAVTLPPPALSLAAPMAATVATPAAATHPRP